MNYTAQWIPYEITNAFSKLAIDYIHQDPALRPFYKYPPSEDGILQAIEGRKLFPQDRNLLVQELNRQYAGLGSGKVQDNIASLAHNNTFTICTAHQPNIFTGYLYFIYKIIHIIKLADSLNQKLKAYHFVPVFFLGSEDNDLDELNRINLNGDELIWDTDQTGAVGRMSTRGIDRLIYRIEGELSVQPFGSALMQLLKSCYLQSDTMQEATFKLVHALFEEFGLVVLLPDSAAFKSKLIPVFEEDIFKNTPGEIVNETAARLQEKYHAQVNPRDINLFYLVEGIRERIIHAGDSFTVNNTKLRFSSSEMKTELWEHPERFSPNVVLRGVFQETLLPNVAFIGGGSEIAYWLEMKDLFEHFQVPYPILILRNSFLIADARSIEKAERLGLSIEDLFKNETDLLNELVIKNSNNTLSLTKELNQTREFYEQLGNTSGAIDPTLTQHVTALGTKAYKALQDLEKKMLRAERRKFELQQAKIHQIKSALFPDGKLQERSENFLPYYAKYGTGFFRAIYEVSPGFEQKFTVILEDQSN